MGKRNYTFKCGRSDAYFYDRYTDEHGVAFSCDLFHKDLSILIFQVLRTRLMSKRLCLQTTFDIISDLKQATHIKRGEP